MPPYEKCLTIVCISQKLLYTQAWNLALQTAWLPFKALSLLEETHLADVLSKI